MGEKKLSYKAMRICMEDTLLAERTLKAAIYDAMWKSIKAKFWNAGDISKSDDHVYVI